jgi:hypothetical protein
LACELPSLHGVPLSRWSVGEGAHQAAVWQLTHRGDKGWPPALRDEKVSDDAGAELASKARERGDEFALKPLRVEEAGAMPPCGVVMAT